MDNFQKAKRILENHGIIAFPTETVCGLGIIYDDEKALHNLDRVKGRPENKPYTLMLSDVEQIEKYAFLSDKAKKIIAKFVPGALTLLLPAKEGLPYWVTRGSNKVGIRISSDELVQNIIRSAGKPLLVPSANRSGEKPCTDMNEVKEIFKDEIGLYFLGVAGMQKPSTIIDLCDNISLIREGDITFKEILEVIGE